MTLPVTPTYVRDCAFKLLAWQLWFKCNAITGDMLYGVPVMWCTRYLYDVPQLWEQKLRYFDWHVWSNYFMLSCFVVSLCCCTDLHAARVCWMRDNKFSTAISCNIMEWRSSSFSCEASLLWEQNRTEQNHHQLPFLLQDFPLLSFTLRFSLDETFSSVDNLGRHSL